MKRKQNIQDAFHSVIPVLAAGNWSVGYSGHTDNSAYLSYHNITITGIRNITDKFIPGTSTVINNDVYVDYSYLSGTTITGTTSIYSYPVATTTTTTVPVTTTTTSH